MSSKVPLPQSSPSTDPALLQATEAITGTHDAKAASGIADMLLIFERAGLVPPGTAENLTGLAE
jgi:hypothetical protein